MISGEGSTEFFDNLCSLIEVTERKIMRSTHGYEPLIEDAINYVMGAYYANLIRLYQHNLNKEFFDLVRMSNEDRRELLHRLHPFFKRANETDESVFNKGELNFEVYQKFRRTIYNFGDDAYWLLLGVEEYADTIKCEHRLIKFRTELFSLRE